MQLTIYHFNYRFNDELILVAIITFLMRLLMLCKLYLNKSSSNTFDNIFMRQMLFIERDLGYLSCKCVIKG